MTKKLEDFKHNEITKAAEEALAAVVKMVCEIGKILTRFAALVVKTLKRFLDIMIWVVGQTNPKHWHYYRHSKKRRIKKKYRDKLIREIVEAYRERFLKCGLERRLM